MRESFAFDLDRNEKTGIVRYINRKEIFYISPRYNKTVTVPVNYPSDGASGPAEDIVSESWWVHDVLCDRGTWDDGTTCSNWQMSWVLHDILKREGRHWRDCAWFLATGIGRPLWNWLDHINPFHRRRKGD